MSAHPLDDRRKRLACGPQHHFVHLVRDRARLHVHLCHVGAGPTGLQRYTRGRVDHRTRSDTQEDFSARGRFVSGTEHVFRKHAEGVEQIVTLTLDEEQAKRHQAYADRVAAAAATLARHADRRTVKAEDVEAYYELQPYFE